MKRFMKVFCLFLSFFLLVGPQRSYSQEVEVATSVSKESRPEMERDDKMLNIDELEDEMIKMNIIDSIKPIPPHPVIVWIRIIGLPMANAYFAVRRVFRKSVHKIAVFFNLKSAASKLHEESPT